MIFSGLEHMGEIPFKYVFIHGIVRDSEGRKMSKSLGNGIDPLEVIEQYGADALRLTLVTGNSPGNDMRFYWERVEASRNFCNKIWNATRFILMNIRNAGIDKPQKGELELPDRWILSRYNNLVKEVTDNLEKFELGIAVQKLYDFIWDEFCDWYIELAKPGLYGQDREIQETKLYVLSHVLLNTMKLLHPFMPFITEEIWQHLPHHQEDSIMISSWPKIDYQSIDPDAESQMKEIMNAIRSIRNIRAEMEVPPSRKAKVVLVVNRQDRSLFEESRIYFERLAWASAVEVRENKEGIPSNAVSAVTGRVQIFMPLEDLVDIDKEMERLLREKRNLEKN